MSLPFTSGIPPKCLASGKLLVRGKFELYEYLALSNVLFEALLRADQDSREAGEESLGSYNGIRIRISVMGAGRLMYVCM